MTALGHAACLRAHSVLFTDAIDVINTLAAAHATGNIKRTLHHYIKPQVLCIDELGYLPIDKFVPTACSRSSATAMSEGQL